MKSVKKVELDLLHRGIVIHFLTTEGDIISLQFTKLEARRLMLRLYRMLGMKRGEGEVD